jgi:signal transduction histidine kinase
VFHGWDQLLSYIMKRNWHLAAFWLCWLCCGTLQAQSPVYDSIVAAIDTMPDDTNKVMAYLHAFRPMVVSDGESAMRLTEKALALATKIGDVKDEAETYRLQGIYYMINGASELALERYQLAFDMFKAQGNKRSQLRSSNNFATVYMELEQYDTALTYLNVFDDYKSINRDDSVLVATTRHNKGICLDMLGQHQAAFEIFSTNLETFKRLNAAYEESFTLTSLAEVAIKLHDPKLAVTYLRNAEVLKRQIDDKRGLSNALILLTTAYHDLGMQDSAIALGRRSMEMAQSANSMDALRDIHKKMAEIYAADGKHAEAYAYAQRFIQLDDSLTKAANSSKVMRLQAAYGLKNKNDEIKQLQQTAALDQANLDRQQLLIISLAVGFVLVLIVLVLIYRASAASARLNKAISAKNQELSTANSALQRSIQEREALVHMVIHDLKSPLNHTEALITAMRDIEGMPGLALKMMDKVETTNRRGMALIADLLALYEMESQGSIVTAPVACTEIVASVMASMESLAVQKGIRLVAAPLASDATVQTNASMVTRILENLVSNGLKFSPRGTEVRVEIAARQGEVVFAVQDQGPGISADDQGRLFQKFMKLTARPTGGEHSNGLGLAIVKKLAERLGGQVGVQSQLGKGARFWVALPAQAS